MGSIDSLNDDELVTDLILPRTPGTLIKLGFCCRTEFIAGPFVTGNVTKHRRSRMLRIFKIQSSSMRIAEDEDYFCPRFNILLTNPHVEIHFI